MSRTTASPVGHMEHSFQVYPTHMPSRSKFDHSHHLTTAFNSGLLIPIYRKFAYPGDTLDISVSTLTRLATQIVPFMDEVWMDVHFWKVPIRLLWSHWKNFMGEQPNKYDPADPLKGTDYLTPQLVTPADGVSFGSIYDYLGVRPGVGNISFNSFDFRAYNLIWNEWYRDENLQDPAIVRTGDDGVDQISDFTLLRRGKRKDYFTGALPFLQKAPAVDLPLGTVAPVVTSSIEHRNSSYYTSNPYGATPYPLTFSKRELTIDGTFSQLNYSTTLGTSSNGRLASSGNTHEVGMYGLYPDNLVCDLREATASTINSLRQAFALQKFYEVDARGGTRYVENILAHFGVETSDARLQRPEFLGGGTFNLNLSIVPQTSSTDSSSPQANLSSYGVINGTTKRIVTSFEEHCVVIGLISCRADLTYQQGMNRDYFRRERIDYYFPEFAHLGEQAVYNREIFTQGTQADEQVFGYQERYADMRYAQNEITGVMRSDAPQSLDIWHLAQDFSSLPRLNKEFIEEHPPVSRVTAVTGENTPEFLANFYFKEHWTRELPVYSVPGLCSHF